MDTRSLTDLVRAIEGGERRAWTALVRHLDPAVQGALRRFDVDHELRADAAAEVWRILFERLGSVRDPERLHGWVAVVATNQMVSLLRRPSRRREVAAAEEAIEIVGAVHQTDRVVEDEVREVLERAVSRLSDREQTVIRSRALTDEPLPLASIERTYGIPAGSIGPTLGRGLSKLRRDPQLRRFFDHPGLDRDGPTEVPEQLAS